MDKLIQILILEDNPADAEIVQFELEEGNINFIAKVVMTKEDFIRELQESPPEIILSDYDLPDYTGALALAEAKRSRPEIPFILVTGAVTENRAIEILTSGAKDYVMKNRLQRLVPAVRRALAEAEEHKARKKGEIELREAHRNLEAEVKRRTAELEVEIEERRQTEEKLKTTLESIADGFFSCDDKWRFVYVNAAAERLLNIRREDLLGKICWDVFPLAIGTQLEREYRLAAAGEARDFENFYEPWSRWFHIRCFPRTGGGMSVYFQDITEHKQADKMLRQSNERLALALRASKAGTWDWDVTTGYIEWSAELFDLFGLDQRNTKASFDAWRNIIHPHDRSIAESRIEQALKNRTTLNSEYRIARPNGEIVWINALGEGQYDDEGRAIRMTGICLDITDRKKAEAERHGLLDEVQREKDRLTALVNSISDEIWFTDTQKKFTLMNPAVIKDIYLDSSNDLDLSKLTSIREVYRADGGVRSVEEHPALRALQGETVKNEEEITHTPGSGEFRHRQVSSSPVRDAGGSIIGAVSVIRDVTESKQAENALREYQMAVEASRDLVVVVDTEYKYTMINDAFLKQRGLLREQVIGKSLEQIIGKEAFETVKSKIAMCFQGEVVNYETPIPYRDIGTRYMNIKYYPLKNNAGVVERVVSVISDITDRKRIEEELRESEARFRSVLDHSLDCVYRCNLQTGYFDYISPSVMSIVGFSADELMIEKAEFSLPMVHPDDLSKMWAAMKNLEETGQAKMEYRLRTKKGDYRWISDHAKLTRDSMGQPLHRYGNVRDITERKQLEIMSQALNSLNAIMLSTHDFDKIMTEVCKTAGKAIGCDSAAVSLRSADHWKVHYVYGFPKETIGLRMNDEEELHALLAVSTKKPVIINDAFNDDRVNRSHMKKRDIHSVMVVPIIRDEEAIGVLFFNQHKEIFNFSNVHLDFANKLATTISLALTNAQLIKRISEELAERRLKDQTLQEYSARLETANRELESFSYSVSHDLRAPLRAIDGYLRMILKKQKDKFDEKTQRQLDQARECVKSTERLIDDLLAFSMLGQKALNIKPIDMRPLIEEAWQELKVSNPERNMTLQIKPMPYGWGDKTLVKQVLVNILSNAIKFTRIRDTATIEVGGREEENEIVYYVKDNGIGFDMRYQDKLFGVFQRFHNASEYEGMGIGLALVARIINKHGGRIWAEGKVGEGATFYFTLPGKGLNGSLH